ncbi:hypothetical protein V501_09208, partial [Pseudogymnoascus sp. VKM F-4519 (FW-2642)]
MLKNKTSVKAVIRRESVNRTTPRQE